MGILDSYNALALGDYWGLCNKFREIDCDRMHALTLQTIKYYRGDSGLREQLREGQAIEAKWYQSLKDKAPDFSLYDDTQILVEMWACWVVYSRKYLLSLQKLLTPEYPAEFGRIGSVVDLGCGVGYTTAGLRELFPRAAVMGTNLRRTVQFKVATEMGRQHDFTVEPSVRRRADLVFASEYFEHRLNPVKHLREVLGVCEPRVVVVANAFSQQSMGHFDFYRHGNAWVENKKMGRLFNAEFRIQGYRQFSTGFWNNRPAVWTL